MRKGFTVIEVMIALTLFTVGLLSLIQIIPANRKLLTQSGNVTQASLLAQEQIEQLRLVPFTEITTGTYAVRSAIEASSSSPYAGYEREIVVSNIDSNQLATGTDTGLKRVIVTVYWLEGSVSRQYQVSTFITAATNGVVDLVANPSGAEVTP